jgi:hypothetical protein
MDATQTLKSIKDMDQDQLAEALPGLHAEALKAKEALRIAQEGVSSATTGMLTKVPAFVEVHEDHMVVNLKSRADKNFVLLSTIKIPLEHVIGAEADPKVEWEI